MTIAILAHDSRKELALQFCTAYSAILSKNTVIATGTTGRMLAQTTGLPVHCYLSGKLGGVQQITSRVACDEVDLVLVPGLAFDREGFRLGYGGGYYDRYLRDFPGSSIGVAFSECITETLPRTIYDIPVNRVVTELEYF